MGRRAVFIKKPMKKEKANNHRKIRCRWCNKATGIIKYYIIADDLENPKPYHVACIKKLETEVIMKMSDTMLHFNE